MKLETIENEKEALVNMATAIKTVSTTIAKNAKLIENDDWIGAQFKLYGEASKLAVRIMLQQLGIRATTKRISLVYQELEEANLHCPVEAVLNLKDEITSGEYQVTIWKPEGELLSDHYLDQVKQILAETNKAA